MPGSSWWTTTYPTDVHEHAGPHHYVAGTHRERMPLRLRLRRHADAEVAREHGGAVVVTGPARTAPMIDTKGIHKGAAADTSNPTSTG